MPSIRYFLANTDHPITTSHPLWHQPLPDRKENGLNGSTNDETDTLTYGGYFKAIADFCSASGWEPMLRVISQDRQRSTIEKDIIRLSIFLEKHGALYHPARLLVDTADQRFAFVVNVAASAGGRRTLPVEVRALERLGDHRPFGWFPTVHASTAHPIPMFLGDWFDGFHEFHLTRQAENEHLSLIVWDGAEEPTLLSDMQAADLYRQATMILAASYDPITTDQIFPWHHAAGDFVVNLAANTVEVKLITVRNHAPVFALTSTSVDERAILDNLIAFCLHLSIRMRLDRIDGVSEIGWAPETCLAPIVDGFFKGLDLTGRISGFPETFPALFQEYFIRREATRLMRMAKQIAESVFAGQPEEQRVVDRHLERHIHQFHRCVMIRKAL